MRSGVPSSRSWLRRDRPVEGVTVERRSNDVRVALEIAGPEPPDTEELAGTVATELGEPVELALLWRFGERAQAEP